MHVRELTKKTRKPACTIADVLAEIEPATAQIRHQKIRGSKMQRVRSPEWRRRGESKGEEWVDKKEVHRQILLRLWKAAGLCMWSARGRRELHAMLVKTEWKCPLGIPRRRRESNIKTDSTANGLERVDWFYLAENMDGWRVFVDTTTKRWVAQN